ncbi:hypothetical protein ACOMHN_002261 [Nucella lapillus]
MRHHNSQDGPKRNQRARAPTSGAPNAHPVQTPGAQVPQASAQTAGAPTCSAHNAHPVQTPGAPAETAGAPSCSDPNAHPVQTPGAPAETAGALTCSAPNAHPVQTPGAPAEMARAPCLAPNAHPVQTPGAPAPAETAGAPTCSAPNAHPVQTPGAPAETAGAPTCSAPNAHPVQTPGAPAETAGAPTCLAPNAHPVQTPGAPAPATGTQEQTASVWGKGKPTFADLLKNGQNNAFVSAGASAQFPQQGGASRQQGNGSGYNSQGNGSGYNSQGNGSGYNSQGNGSGYNSQGNGSGYNSQGNGSGYNSQGNGSGYNKGRTNSRYKYYSDADSNGLNCNGQNNYNHHGNDCGYGRRYNGSYQEVDKEQQREALRTKCQNFLKTDVRLNGHCRPLRPKGMKNSSGNDCFILSAVQALLGVSSFTLLLAQFSEALCDYSLDLLALDAPYCSAMLQVWRNYTKRASNSPVLQNLSALKWGETVIGSQGDSSEVLCILINKMQEELKKLKDGAKEIDRRENAEKHQQPEEEEGWQQVKVGRRARRQLLEDKTCPISQIFAGSTINLVEQSATVEPTSCLSVPIMDADISSLNHALGRLFRAERTENNKMTRRFFFELPQTLILELKNYDCSFRDDSGNSIILKNEKQILLSEFLFLNPGFFHIGNSYYNGHYVSIRRNFDNPHWSFFDDERVETFTTEQVLNYWAHFRTPETIIPHGLVYEMVSPDH